MKREKYTFIAILLFVIWIGFVAYITYKGLTETGFRYSDKEHECIENLPTHVLCVKYIHILDENYNTTQWECSLKSDTDTTCLPPVWERDSMCDSKTVSMNDCIAKMFEIKTRESVIS